MQAASIRLWRKVTSMNLRIDCSILLPHNARWMTGQELQSSGLAANAQAPDFLHQFVQVLMILAKLGN